MALIKVGALWLNEKNGKKFFSGTLNDAVPAGAKVFVFKNTHKKDDRHPDYTINVATDDDAPQREAPPPPQEDVPF